MVVFESLSDIGRADGSLVGSKAKALANLAAHGFEVPRALCISAEGYNQYMSVTNLRERVLFELGRKRFEDMRWEEVWDDALRIRNLFLITPIPGRLHTLLHDAVTRLFGDAPVVVRSSATGEDSAEASFAGLHESFVNMRGPADVLKHVDGMRVVSSSGNDEGCHDGERSRTGRSPGAEAKLPEDNQPSQGLF